MSNSCLPTPINSFKNFKDFILYGYIWGTMCTLIQVLMRHESCIIQEADVRVGCDSPDVDVRNWTEDLCNSSLCLLSLSHFTIYSNELTIFVKIIGFIFLFNLKWESLVICLFPVWARVLYTAQAPQLPSGKGHDKCTNSQIMNFVQISWWICVSLFPQILQHYMNSWTANLKAEICRNRHNLKGEER